MDDLIRNHPFAVVVAFLSLFALMGLLLGLLQWAAKRAVNRLDEDIKGERSARKELALEVAGLKIEIVRWEGRLDAQSEIVQRHMSEEERRVWPKLDAIHKRFDQLTSEAAARARDDASSHAVILDRIASHGAEIAALKVLVLNGGEKP